MFTRRIAIMSSRRLGKQKNVTLKTSSVRLHQDECLLDKGACKQIFVLFCVLYGYFHKCFENCRIRYHEKSRSKSRRQSQSARNLGSENYAHFSLYGKGYFNNFSLFQESQKQSPRRVLWKRCS